MHDARTRVEESRQLPRLLGPKVYETIIHRNTRLLMRRRTQAVLLTFRRAASHAYTIGTKSSSGAPLPSRHNESPSFQRTHDAPLPRPSCTRPCCFRRSLCPARCPPARGHSAWGDRRCAPQPAQSAKASAKRSRELTDSTLKGLCSRSRPPRASDMRLAPATAAGGTEAGFTACRSSRATSRQEFSSSPSSERQRADLNAIDEASAIASDRALDYSQEQLLRSSEVRSHVATLLLLKLPDGGRRWCRRRSPPAMRGPHGRNDADCLAQRSSARLNVARGRGACSAAGGAARWPFSRTPGQGPPTPRP